MSAEWVNEYVGVPYRAGGTTRDGWDCWHLVRAVYRDRLAIELPDWTWREPFGLAAKLRAFDAALGDIACTALELAAAEPFAIALVVQGARPHHVGVATGAGVLHAERWAGTRHDPMTSFAFAYPATRWWRWLA